MTASRTAVARHGPACIWCGREPWPADLTAEHLLPRSRGGRSDEENLAAACSRCNRRRRSKPVAAYVRELQRAGIATPLDRLVARLEQLAQSRHRRQAEYGRRQMQHVRGLMHERPANS